MHERWNHYPSETSYDELITEQCESRPGCRHLVEQLANYTEKQLLESQQAMELTLQLMGVTFTVYTSEGSGIDRTWPVDIIPRVIEAREWRVIEAGLKQRIQALNMFISDIYGSRNIIRAGKFPPELLSQSKNLHQYCMGMRPPLDQWAHICGSDLVRDRDGHLYVLEDNLRIPSGASYTLINRLVMKRVFPDLFQKSNILPVDDYPAQLFDMLAALSPRPADYPSIVVLTPGIYNSAYFEHVYLAEQMGVEVVMGSDLMVGDDDCVYMRTIEGLERIDVIYRRVDDDFIDPETGRADSMLGTPGLIRAWRKGNVAIANAPGCGLADDKVIYAFVPEFIRFYLGEEPKVDNVPTYRCYIDSERSYVLAHLHELVVKPANESGGYGMLIGPFSTAREREQFAHSIRKDPRNFIAQPTLDLSTCPTLCNNRFEPRHVDLRPFILSGTRVHVTRGGLTRVALRRGTLIVNSSQGGGSKDTWIVDETTDESEHMNAIQSR